MLENLAFQPGLRNASNPLARFVPLNRQTLEACCSPNVVRDLRNLHVFLDMCTRTTAAPPDTAAAVVAAVPKTLCLALGSLRMSPKKRFLEAPMSTGEGRRRS